MTNTGIMPLNFPRQHFNTQITLGARESVLNQIKRLMNLHFTVPQQNSAPTVAGPSKVLLKTFHPTLHSPQPTDCCSSELPRGSL